MPLSPGSFAGRPQRSRNRYPAIDGQMIGQFIGVRETIGKTFEDRAKPDGEARTEPFLLFEFVLLRRDEDPEKGHGCIVAIKTRKPSYIGRPEPGRNASKAYNVLTRLFGVKDLSDDQLRNLVELVNNLEVEQPQYNLVLDTSDTGWVNITYIGKRVPEHEQLPRWTRPEPALDPRTADDDPSIVCSVTGEVIHGWAKSDGAWVRNDEWAEMQRARLGTNPIYEFPDVPGKFFAPPFSSRYYKLAKAQRQSEDF